MSNPRLKREDEFNSDGLEMQTCVWVLDEIHGMGHGMFNFTHEENDTILEGFHYYIEWKQGYSTPPSGGFRQLVCELIWYFNGCMLGQ